MEKELGSDVIKATQVSLGKYVKRPPLSEKLLKKPPFRFLHDIITTVLKTTGFFKGLFEEEELLSDNVKERDSKILFLNKVTTVLALSTGKSLSVKPSKIVAGQEPEKTNELLQCLAFALDNNISSDEAVKRYKEDANISSNGEIKIKDTKKSVKTIKDPKETTSKTSLKSISKKEPNIVNKTSNTKEKDKNITNTSVKKQITAKSELKKKQETKKIKERIENIPQLQHEKPTEDHHEIEKVAQNTDENSVSLQNNNSVILLDSNIPVDQEDQEILTSSLPQIESSSSQSFQENINVENDKFHEHLIQDNFAVIAINENVNLASHAYIDKEDKGRNNDEKITKIEIVNQSGNENDYEVAETLAALKEKSSIDKSYKKNTDNTRPVSVRPSSSRPSAPRLRDKLDNVISDTDNTLLGKVNIIVENSSNEEEEDTNQFIIDREIEPMSLLQNKQELQLSSNEHGHLVQQILDSQKEFSQISGKTEIEWQFGAQKAKDSIHQEIEQLRLNIQTVSRVANPLGKLLDHIQEDVEVMRQELQQWTTVYEDVSKEMLKQKLANEDSFLPLQSRRKQLEVDIEEKHDKINDLKIMIHKNTSRIEKLLTSGNVQSNVL